jgi:hypothetical protein
VSPKAGPLPGIAALGAAGSRMLTVRQAMP